MDTFDILNGLSEPTAHPRIRRARRSRRRLGLLGLAVLPVAGCGVAAQGGQAGPATCEENGGQGVVQIKWENELGCDLVPPQELTLVIDGTSWAAHTGSAEGWGGDASLAWAQQELDDAGCSVTWHGGEWAEGTTCDY